MTPPRVPPQPVGDPMTGPYDEANGRDAYDHPVNGFGRCEGMNVDPPTCPPAEEAQETPAP